MEITICHLCAQRLDAARRAVQAGDVARAQPLFDQMVFCHRDGPGVPTLAATELIAGGRPMEALRYCIEAIRRAPGDVALHKRFLGAAFKARCQHGYDDEVLAKALWEAWAQAYAPALPMADATEGFLAQYAEHWDIRTFLPSLVPPDDEINQRMLRALDGFHRVEGGQSHDTPESYEAVQGNHLLPLFLARFMDRQLPADVVSGLEFGVGSGQLKRYLAPGRQMVGLDLSADMLALAGDKGYDQLIQADITTGEVFGEFDFVASVGTLLYFFDLTAVFRTAYLNLRPGGALIFGLAACSDNAYRTQLTESKSAHRRRYLEDVARESGFEVVSIAIANQFAAGYHVHLRKPA